MLQLLAQEKPLYAIVSEDLGENGYQRRRKPPSFSCLCFPGSHLRGRDAEAWLLAQLLGQGLFRDAVAKHSEFQRPSEKRVYLSWLEGSICVENIHRQATSRLG